MRGRFSGVWLPIVTPFVDGEIDYAGYERLVDHYVRTGVAGVIPLGTTGESPTVGDAETDMLIESTVAAVDGRVPILVGVSGNDTRKVVKTVKRLERHRIDGLLATCPYYNRPSQDGLREHFTRVAGATDRPVLIYNIPYRTGVNLANDTLLALAELPNIAGVKDSSGDVAQSLALLRRRPGGFSVLTGEDAYFYTMLAHGGDGGILASAHLETEAFVAIHERMTANDHHGARRLWSTLEATIPLLFEEPNPMPIKHCLWRLGLIRSPECRLSLTRISRTLADELERSVCDVAAVRR
jgi:4-hydroxy-tetrahydrodipicolinate synthase